MKVRLLIVRTIQMHESLPIKHTKKQEQRIGNKQNRYQSDLKTHKTHICCLWLFFITADASCEGIFLLLDCKMSLWRDTVKSSPQEARPRRHDNTQRQGKCDSPLLKTEV